MKSALIKLSDAVDGFMLRYKRPMEDAIQYYEHGCRCYMDIVNRHSNAVTTEKVTVSALGIVEMPTGMTGFVNLYVPIYGEWWSFTDKPRMVNTTTGTGVDETRDDADAGEGVAIRDAKYWDYGGVGGVNDYYMSIDWDARRIFLDGLKSSTAVLVYTGTGIETTTDTYIPEMCVEVIDMYLMWKESLWLNSARGEKEARKRDYVAAVQQLRIHNFMPTGDQIRDIIYSTTTQAPQR